MSLGFSRPALKLLDFKLLSNKRTKLLASTRLLPTTYLTSTAPASVAVDSTIPMGPWNLPPSCRWLTQEPGQRTTPERAFHSLRSSQPVVTSNPPEATDPVVYGPWHLPPSCRYLLQPPTKPSVGGQSRATLSTMRAGRRVPDLRSMPSQHQGFVKGPAAHGWRPAKILVDSGSQQPPLMSASLATEMGLTGMQVDGAECANGDILPIYSVGGVNLAVNGRAKAVKFYSADIHPYDVILGEDWLHHNRAILDYDSCQLLQRDSHGRVTPLYLNALPPGGDDGVMSACNTPPTHAEESCVVGSADTLGSALDRRVQAAQCTDRAHDLQRKSLGARARRTELRAAMRQALGAITGYADKCLPEDDELVLEDIPGLNLPSPSPSQQGSASPSAFSFIESEVRTHLAHMPEAVREGVIQRLRTYESTVFETRKLPRLAPRRGLDMDITEYSGARPVARRPYRVAPQHKAELNRQLDLLLEAGIIRKSYSPYASPCLFAPKADGSLRLCVDYRQLNLQTVRDRFPTPTAADLIQRTWGAKLFSKIDLMSGFHQLRIREEHAHKTAFVTEDGHYEWVVCPFGLSSTPSCFQRLMSTVLEEHIRAGYVVVYVDDICIFTKTDDPHEHLEKLEKVLDSLRQHDLLAKGSKCSLFRTEMEFLGFLVSADGTRPTPSKVEAVVRMAPPETVSQLRSFLGMMNFFASHIAAFSERASPLTDLLRGATTGRQRLLWSPRCEQAFRDLKSALISTPVLRGFDPSLRTAVHVDGSQSGVGAVLLQWEEGQQDPRPVCFLSRKLQGAQFQYDAHNVEALAIQIALQEWRTLLYDVPFEIYSDHRSLHYLFSQKNPSQRILRLCEFLSGFNFKEVQYVKGEHAAVPDFFSRSSALHALSRMAKGGEGKSSNRVRVLPVCAGHIGVVQSRGSDGVQKKFLLSKVVPTGSSAESVVRDLLLGLEGTGARPPRLRCVSHGPDGSAWRADYDDEVVMGLESARPEGEGFLWVRLAGHSLDMSDWGRSSVSALTDAGVISSAQGLSVLTDVLVSSSLLDEIAMATSADAFLSKVLCRVQESDTGSWRDFSLGVGGVIQYQRSEDLMPRVCVPHVCRAAVLHTAHGDSVLAGHPGMERTVASVARSYWWPGLHRDVAHFVRSCRTCAAAKSSTALRLGVESHSAVPVEPFSNWAMDLIGPVSLSKAGNDLILTWVDKTSKMIAASPLSSKASSSKDLAALTWRHICCRFGLPLVLTHDNDVRFGSLWKELWRLVGTKNSFTTAYNPQADPAERANRQVLEALRGAVATVTSYDEWDEALPHLCFGLNTHVSSATGVSPFELAHGFPARVPHTFGITSRLQPSSDMEADDFALRVRNRFRAAADNVAAAQARIGIQLDARARPADVKVGDYMYLDGRHVPSQVPLKFASRWFGPFRVLAARGPVVQLDLPATLGKMSPWVNVRRLKFFEERDADLAGPDDGLVVPLISPVAGSHDPRYEVDKILWHRTFKNRREMLVRWKGYDESHNQWVRRSVLEEDVPALVLAYDADPSVFVSRKSAPKRATRGPPDLMQPAIRRSRRSS